MQLCCWCFQRATHWKKALTRCVRSACAGSPSPVPLAAGAGAAPMPARLAPTEAFGGATLTLICARSSVWA